MGGCYIFPRTCRVKVCISYMKSKIRFNLRSLKKYHNICIKNAICCKKRWNTKLSQVTRLRPENNVRNKEVMLKKMYKSSKVRKFVLEKMPNSLIFLSNKKSSYSHFYLSIPPNILQGSYNSQRSM